MAAAKKLDLYKLHQAEYIAPRKPALLVIKPAVYLAVTGQGAPASAEFQEKIGAIYSVAFTIKMTKKFAGQDYKVCHLEGLWSVGEVSMSLKAGPPETRKGRLGADGPSRRQNCARLGRNGYKLSTTGRPKSLFRSNHC